MEIVKRPKNDSDLDIVLKEISESENIICYSKKELLHLVDVNAVYLGYENNQLIGAGMIKRIDNNWVELATLIILKKFQGKGYGRQLFDYLFSQIKDKKITSSSKNPRSQKWFEEKGFQSVKLLSLPREVLIHALKTKIRFYKLKDLFSKGLRGNWKYYIKS